MSAPAPAGADELPELSVQNFAACEVRRGLRLLGAPVDGDTAYLVLAGTLHMRLPAGRLSASTGAMVLVPPKLELGIAPSPGPARDVVATRSCLLQRGGLLVFDAAYGGPGDLRVIVGRVVGGLSQMLAAPGTKPKPIVAELGGSPLARAARSTLLAELDEPGFGTPALSITLMKACLLQFIREVRGRAETRLTPATGNNLLAAVIAAVLARPSEKHSVASLAELAGMSRAAFGRRFVEATGTSPMEFVLKARLQDAAAMLRTTAMPIKQVAAENGFLSRSHFSRVFTSAFGADPSSFRAAERQGADPAIMENTLS